MKQAKTRGAMRRMALPRRAWVGLVACSVALSMMPAVSGADDLEDQQASLQQQIGASDSDVYASDAKLQDAEKTLSASQQQLADAQAGLARAEADRDAAARSDDDAARALKDAEAALVKAQDDAAKARADVDAQKRKVGTDVRHTTQQNSGLVTIGIFVNNLSTGDMSNRIQWTDQAFRAQQYELDRLQDVEQRLEQAEQAMKDAEAAAQRDRQAAADALNSRASTEQAAQDAKAKVDALVSKNAADKSAAEQALADAQARNADLKAQSNAVAQRIKDRNAAAAAAAQAAQQADAAAAQAAAAGNSIATSTSSVLADPVPGAPITDTYHTRINPVLGYTEFHDGLDLGAGCNAPMYAAAAGTVADVLTPGQSGGYGNRLVIDHGLVNGVYLSTGYNHASSYVVSAGQHVDKGQLIGYVGTTGLSTGCHLHFHVYVNGATDDPQNWITVA
ncbi:M23 family metallopeptidase [Propionibacterium freudenreichii]|uniref:M23 family metallopeptidase n=1 Tax=Propionibacterium freudenreichii TaxID=1744 RepID=UPI0012D82CC8|nr:M23 family metallopeptidase [Propionibacterium freudenreichii]